MCRSSRRSTRVVSAAVSITSQTADSTTGLRTMCAATRLGTAIVSTIPSCLGSIGYGSATASFAVVRVRVARFAVRRMNQTIAVVPLELHVTYSDEPFSGVVDIRAIARARDDIAVGVVPVGGP